MKKLFIILLLFFSLASFSQTKDSVITIKGVVMDVDYNEPISFASVSDFLSENNIQETSTGSTYNASTGMMQSIK